MGSRLDQIYRNILATKFFTHGWGKPENLQRLFAFRKKVSNRETCRYLVDPNHSVKIIKEKDSGDHILLEAEFISPFTLHLPGLVPPECEKAHFQVLLPKKWKSHLRPICLHLAGTGDHGYWRRRVLMARPLLQESGIASIILENPFYGIRKPRDQKRSSLHNVSDLFVMGGCLVLESLVIFHWCEREGLGPVGITGISMGGHMASLAATNWHKPLPLVPCLSWTTASGVFTQGVMSGAINWELLKNQYFEDEVFREVLFNMIQSPEGHFRVYHEVGREFARKFPESLEFLQDFKEKSAFLDEKKLSMNSNNNNTEQKNCKDINNNHYNSSVKTSTLSAVSGTDHSRCDENLNGQCSCHHCCDEVVQVKSVAGGSLSGSLSCDVVEQTSVLHSGHRNADFTLRSLLSPKVWKDISNISFSGVNPAKEEENFLNQSHLTPVSVRPSSSKHLPPVSFKPYVAVKDHLTWEAIQFMRGIMDECTHIANFSKPVDTSLVIIVSAMNDAYMPRVNIMPLDKIWPGAELRYLNSGHIVAYLFNQQIFRKAITDAFQLCITKYYS